jgi:hypothetical protein
MMRRIWIPVLVGLLVAVLLGPAGGAVAAAEPRVTVASIMVPAAAFTPTVDEADYLNAVNYLGVNNSGHYFFAPLSFASPEVSVRRITLYAYDNDADASHEVCVWLYRSNPATAGAVFQGSVCTSDDAADPQAVFTTAIAPKTVNTAVHGSYLRIGINPGAERLYGVKVTYTYETTP